MEQNRLDKLRIAAQLGAGLTPKDLQDAPEEQTLAIMLALSKAVEILADEVERLSAGPDLVMEMDSETGEVLTQAAENSRVRQNRTERTFAPIGTTGHLGPIRVGQKVQALAPVGYADIMKGEIGKLTDFDSWSGEEYPYIATFDGGRSAAFAREDIRRID
jgi:hypothetical protein